MFWKQYHLKTDDGNLRRKRKYKREILEERVSLFVIRNFQRE